MVALRSLAVEMAAFRQFRNSLVLVSLVVMALALAVAYFTASRITGPVRRLVSVVERARDGKYSGAVAVDTSDEIGILARAFNSLLADLREKEQMIGFLREGMTLLKKGVGRHQRPTGSRRAATTSPPDAAAAARPAIGQGQRCSRAATRSSRRAGQGRHGRRVPRARPPARRGRRAQGAAAGDARRTTPTLVDRFKQEIKLARRITHRNVLRTHDFGEAQGTPYISMEYLEGVTLKDLDPQQGRAAAAGVGLRIAKQICQGLEAAHRQGVVHRDIKPQNMLILPETGELKIMDFGIARVSEVKRASRPGLTTAGTVMGTPDYMPPEQAQGHAGRLPLRHLLARRRALRDVHRRAAVRRRHRDGGDPGAHPEAPPSPRKLNAGLPPELEAVILRCLEKGPKKRFQKVGEVLEALSDVSAGVEAA